MRASDGLERRRNRRESVIFLLTVLSWLFIVGVLVGLLPRFKGWPLTVAVCVALAWLLVQAIRPESE